MTKQEIVYSILDIIKPENLTNSNITTELIEYYIDVVRAQLLSQSLNKGHSIPSSNIQSLGCIPITLIDKSECCDAPVDCKIARTTLEIPKMISMHNRDMITRVGPIDITQPQFDMINYSRVPFESYSRFNFTKSFMMNDNRFIYLISKDSDTILLEYINVMGVIEKPSDASTFSHCSGDTCYSNKSEYPLQANMLPTLIELVCKKFLLQTAQIPVDKSNDNESNSTPQILNK